MNRKRILILRPDNIGDVVLFTGALLHIRKLYPDAHITLAVRAHIVNLVELCPYIDTCIPINHLTWWGEIEHKEFPFKHRIARAVHAANRLYNSLCRPFDTIVFPVKSPHISYLEVIYCLHATQIIGIGGCSLNAPKEGCPSKLLPDALFTSYLDVSNIDPWKHELLTTLDFLHLAGCRDATLDDIKPQFWLANSERNHLDAVPRQGRKIIGLFPGTSWEGKCWEPDNYGELAKLLGGRTIYALFGSSADKGLTDRAELSIRALCGDVEILNLTGQTTLRELVKTIMSCDLLISMDTSGLHVAIAAGVPAIGIVGGGHFGRFVPWGEAEKNIFLTREMSCFYCNWQCINATVDCIKGVSPEEVAAAAAKLLQ